MSDLSHTIMFRIVEGSVRNVLDGHPEWTVPKNFARSVAKRAAGTMSSLPAVALLAPAKGSDERLGLSRDQRSGGSAALSRSQSDYITMLEDRADEAKRSGKMDRYSRLMNAVQTLRRELAR